MTTCLMQFRLIVNSGLKHVCCISVELIPSGRQCSLECSPCGCSSCGTDVFKPDMFLNLTCFAPARKSASCVEMFHYSAPWLKPHIIFIPLLLLWGVCNFADAGLSRALLTLTTNSMLTAVALNDWLHMHSLPL